MRRLWIAIIVVVFFPGLAFPQEQKPVKVIPPAKEPVKEAPAVTPPLKAFVAKWGTQGSGDGQFRRPTGIAIGADGNIYVADFDNHRIQVFSPQGAFIRKWGSQGSGNGQFNYPLGVAVDILGNNIYVVDTNNNRIQVFSRYGAWINGWGSVGSGNGQFNSPRSVAVDNLGNVYVADGNGQIQVFPPRGFSSPSGAPWVQAMLIS